MKSITSTSIEASRFFFNKQGKPIMAVDIHTNFFWVDILPNRTFLYTNIPHLINVPEDFQKETTSPTD